MSDPTPDDPGFAVPPDAFDRLLAELAAGRNDDADDAEGDEHRHPSGLVLCPACDAGQWVVTTHSGSHYLVDLDREVVLRVPDPDRTAPATSLRRDTEEIPLLWMSQVRLGHPVIFHLDLRQDGVTTERVTSAVVSAERALAVQPD